VLCINNLNRCTQRWTQILVIISRIRSTGKRMCLYSVGLQHDLHISITNSVVGWWEWERVMCHQLLYKLVNKWSQCLPNYMDKNTLFQVSEIFKNKRCMHAAAVTFSKLENVIFPKMCLNMPYVLNNYCVKIHNLYFEMTHPIVLLNYRYILYSKHSNATYTVG